MNPRELPLLSLWKRSHIWWWVLTIRSGTDVPVRLLGERYLVVCTLPRAKGKLEGSQGARPALGLSHSKLELGHMHKTETFPDPLLGYWVRCKGTEGFPKAEAQPSGFQDSLVWLP